MNESPRQSRHIERIVLGSILILFALMSVIGITWGLPGRKIDQYLFGDEKPWSGEKIYRLAGAGDKFSPDRGADVDADPLDKQTDDPILLTGTDEDVAKIYLRYRLYTYQPDEMITMMALAGMQPREFKFDPRLYQYGGLFIYPVGALIKLCGILGLIDVRSDVVYYLDNPDEFGKFYIVARTYSALWGLVGVIVVFAITRRLSDSRAGLLAAFLFTLMPVVVCMSHEGKPHLPGAVLMLSAVYFAMRSLNIRATGFSPRGDTDDQNARASLGHGTHIDQEHQEETCPRKRGHGTRGNLNWWMMCICCGAALGMVLSSWPIFVLIPLVVYLDTRPAVRTATRAAGFSPREDTDVQPASPRDDKGIQPASPREDTDDQHAHASVGMAPDILTIIKKTTIGVGIALAVYLITNPYVLINAIVNREVLRSNFGNSFAMYEISRMGEGLIRVLELTVEGATLPILILGVVALVVAVIRKKGSILPLAVPALLFFTQFVLIGAGKPAEYGRFGIFTNVALIIGTSCLLTKPWFKLRRMVNIVTGVIVVMGAGLFGLLYLQNFLIDTKDDNSRFRLTALVHGSWKQSISRDESLKITIDNEPAPYNCPPILFSAGDVYLINSKDDALRFSPFGAIQYIKPVDRLSYNKSLSYPLLWEVVQHECVTYRHLYYHSTFTRWLSQTPISWANKPFHEELWYAPPFSEWSNRNDEP